ncbi:MAG: class I SAM-dependent RNA methyltransferase [Bacteroidetes bacterium]|nr:class I SAM-dependent RNA methyltransferase [Bacteroidota bacterium]
MSAKDSTNISELTITLKTFFGFEEVLKEELEEMGYTQIEILNRAVQIKGTWADVYSLNYTCRCAISVLVQLASFRIEKEEDLYKKASKIDWTELFDADKTFAVKGAIFSTIFRHSQYPFLLVKDAIVDQFREKGMDRPNVQVKAPQVMFDLYIREKEVVISLNTSGAPLFHRGYRESVGDAPLNEVVAAGLIRMSGWDRKTPFYDPFCGSGTLLIEAAMLALDMPAAIERTHFAFKNFRNFDHQLWTDLTENTWTRPNTMEVEIAGSDSSADMMMKAKRNLRGLGLARWVEVKPDAFLESKKPFENGMIVTNPPYGERMGVEVEELYDELGTWLKHSMTGFTAWIISSNDEALKKIGLKPSKKIKVFNGDLECSFRKFDLFDGSKKDQVTMD